MPPATRSTKPTTTPAMAAPFLSFDLKTMEMMLPRPKLKDLLPITVNDFMVKFAAHNVYVKSSLQIEEANLQICIEPTVLKKLEDLDVEVTSREALMSKLKEISEQDAGSRKIHVIQQAEQLVWQNCGNIPASARHYVRRADLLKKNLVFDD